MAGLTAPSLMELRIVQPSLFPFSIAPTIHLSKFLHTTGKQFFSAKLNVSKVRISLSMRTDPHLDDDPPFTITIIASKIPSIQSMGDMISATLATVQDVFLASPLSLFPNRVIPHNGYHPLWRVFFALFQNAKILRLAPGIESEVGAILRPDNGVSALQPLPVLEEIELNATTPPDTPTRINEEELASVLDLFKTFVNARRQEGHPVNVQWNTDRVFPRYFCEAESTVL
jgi:hypothetical protein